MSQLISFISNFTLFIITITIFTSILYTVRSILIFIFRLFYYLVGFNNDKYN